MVIYKMVIGTRLVDKMEVGKMVVNKMKRDKELTLPKWH
jgi:hypothetical protein